MGHPVSRGPRIKRSAHQEVRAMSADFSLDKISSDFVGLERF
jgi:hypothetical protein